MNAPANPTISAEGYAGLLIVQTHLLHSLVHDIIATVQATDPTVQVTRALKDARERAAALYAETDAGKCGMPDFGPLAALFDAEAGWRLKRALEIALIDAARKHLLKHIPGLKAIEVELGMEVDEFGKMSHYLEYACATFQGERWISFGRDTQTNSGPFGLVLHGSSEIDDSEGEPDEESLLARHAALLGCEAKPEVLKGRIDSIAEFLGIYYSHTRLEPGIDTILEATA